MSYAVGMLLVAAFIIAYTSCLALSSHWPKNSLFFGKPHIRFSVVIMVDAFAQLLAPLFDAQGFAVYSNKFTVSSRWINRNTHYSISILSSLLVLR